MGKSLKDVNQVTVKGVGKVTHKAIQKTDYEAFKKKSTAVRQGKYGFGEILGTGNAKTVHRSATLRKRKVGAKRESLANINVTNPIFAPIKNNKSHGIPDTFGGPNVQSNLINEEQSVNLQLHKRIENTMAHFMKQSIGVNDKNATKRRGSMEMSEEIDNAGRSTSRQYYVHTDAGNGQPERFDLYTMKRF